ncbi:uncharacterized protein LOC111894036 [Lactuca sativa]|uniref:uncharacterized protein LOC111894036 n=1 Tax=Lactuca sativa TaxID=4236 RepID=UPI000CD7F2AA|nr:uncharacterized protein LOC111894036 [Lactuca sativa]XP_023745871.1 uncharacterized protein LOC111894036 [Lactuca sativa]XP_042752781.1 uncharacterized protein LOC111894036 [Lactuca sativa]XP_042752782.1 uncharacterized protein LOC111894036 [Lactuca sativa]XP_042752783.1 uncharacterized protein LOC111894036 [Lactuca sativa]XP_042752785.1 uncharacterized protein LOC111894036 [Lactuca sativa]XP_042752786.1 uncharacterized protein LOC111894036 [Lactuca sativa]XP_052621255.1 uncharacterized p
MDPHIFIARAEAQRWLGIAEKLLMSHDLVGSKTFAIRARESDPRLEAADQILAVVDTLIAAEKQVVGNNGVQQPDFYGILQLVRFVQDTDHIASQYQRLAFILNPHQNRFPFSDQAFQIVNEAWSVLSNPMRKSMYDSELDFPPQLQMNTIGFNLEEQQQQQQEQHNFFSIDYMGSDHQQKSPEQEQTFQTRVQRTHQQQESQQHNFLSRNQSAPVHEEDEQLFQHHEQEQLFQPQVEPLEVMSTPYQQNPPQSPQPQPSMQSITPPPAAPPQPPLSWPQAPSLSQPQQPHQKQQPPLQPQQQEAWVEQNAGPVHSPNQVNSDNGVKKKETETEAVNMDESPTFWTACPYCFYMYEYQRIYAECTIRCDNCKRAFQAVGISSPPLMAEGQEDYFYCWGYYPLGVSISHLPKTARTNSKWTPFSPLHDASSNVQNHFNSREAPKKNTFVKKDLGPRIYIDDITDDIFTGISEPSDDSDVEWNMTRDKS